MVSRQLWIPEEFSWNNLRSLKQIFETIVPQKFGDIVAAIF